MIEDRGEIMRGLSVVTAGAEAIQVVLDQWYEEEQLMIIRGTINFLCVQLPTEILEIQS